MNGLGCAKVCYCNFRKDTVLPWWNYNKICHACPLGYSREGRLCRNVIAREGNDRSNLISSRIHEITTTPERRLVTCDLKGYDKEELRHNLFAGMTTLLILCWYAKLSVPIQQIMEKEHEYRPGHDQHEADEREEKRIPDLS